MRDDGVSELLGYAILAGMVVTAVICIASGTGGVISSSVESAGLSEAAQAMGSLAATAMDAARDNNTYFTASQLQVPAGYELISLDAGDDIGRLSVSCEGRELFDAREGSIRLAGPFRSVSFEGGAVFVNDSGSVEAARKPSIFVASGDGGRSLYFSVVNISTDSCVVSGSASRIAELRAIASFSVRLHAGGDVTIKVTSHDPEGWAEALQDDGFAVTRSGNAVMASAGVIADVCVSCTTLQVRLQ